LGLVEGKGFQDWQGQRLVEMVHELQPVNLLNDRMGVDPDFYTPEQLQPAQWGQVDGRRVKCEACHTLNGSWGCDRDNLDWKSPELLVRMLIDTVSKGGNLLLLVGKSGRKGKAFIPA
jgi:alpha-L-fucosidase